MTNYAGYPVMQIAEMICGNFPVASFDDKGRLHLDDELSA